MTKQKSLTIKFVSDTAKAEQAVDRLQAKINRLNGKGSGPSSSSSPVGSVLGAKGDAFKSMAGDMGSVSGAADGILGKLGGLSSSLFGINPAGMAAAAGLAAVTYAASKTINAGIQAEDAITKLTVLLGNDKLKSLKTYKQAVDFSNVTPFDPADVVPMAVIAGQYGFDAFKQGWGRDGKKNLATLIGDMASFSGQTMEEASTALFRGDLQLLDKYGKAGRDAYQNATKAGAIGSDAFRSAFIKNMSEVQLWEGMADKRSRTISGMWSTIVGNFNTAFLYLSGAAEGDQTLTFWGQLRGIISDITEGSGNLLESLRPYLIEFGAYVGAGLSAVWDVLKSIYTVMKPALFAVGLVLKGLFFYTITFTTKVFQIIGWVARQVAFVSDTVQGWISGAQWIVNASKGFVEWVENVTLKIQMVLAFIGLWWDGFWESARRTFQNLPEIISKAFSDAWERIKNMPIIDILKNTITNPAMLIPGAAPIAAGVNIVEGYLNTPAPVQQPGRAAPSSSSTTTNNRSNATVNNNIMVQSPTEANAVLKSLNNTGKPK